MYTTIQEAREAIKNCGMSKQSGYEWNLDNEKYASLEKEAAHRLWWGKDETPEESLKKAAIKIGFAKATDF